MVKEIPAFCVFCEKDVDSDHWLWAPDSRYLGGGHWRCKEAKARADIRYRNKLEQNPARKANATNRKQKYYDTNRDSILLRCYKHADAKSNRESDLTLEQAHQLMSSPCFYCGITPARGIERQDSNLGHTLANSVPACEVCNLILRDIPLQVKLLLAEGLQEARKAGHLDSWVIPIKRGKGKPGVRML